MFGFEDVYQKYSTAVYRFLLSLTRDEVLAEELLQETFYRALLNIDKFEGRSSLYTWLCQIGKNAWLKECKKKNVYHASPIEEFVDMMSTTPLPEEQVMHEEEYKKVKNHLKSKKTDDYNVQAYSEDFYIVYRIAEKIIRANKLDYINWRIIIDDAKSPHIPYDEPNALQYPTGLIDALKGDDDALAFIVAQEIAHCVLGNYQRLNFQYMMAFCTNDYSTYKMKYKPVVLRADVEAAKLLLKAGYNVKNVQRVFNLSHEYDPVLSTLIFTKKYKRKRLKNFEDNSMYFLPEV